MHVVERAGQCPNGRLGTCRGQSACGADTDLPGAVAQCRKQRRPVDLGVAEVCHRGQRGGARQRISVARQDADGSATYPAAADPDGGQPRGYRDTDLSVVVDDQLGDGRGRVQGHQGADGLDPDAMVGVGQSAGEHLAIAGTQRAQQIDDGGTHHGIGRADVFA